MKYVLLALLWTSVLAGVVLAVGPVMEARYLPVVTDAAFVVASRGRDRMAIDWTAVRQRGYCQFKGAEARVLRGSEWHLAILSRADDDGDTPLPAYTRPPGFQRMTRLDVIPDGSALRMTLRHRCHPLWMTVTQLPAVVL